MKILLPIDGSECSMKTLRWAADMFSKQNNQFYLLLVISIGPDLLEVESEVMAASKLLSKAKVKLEQWGCRVAKIAYRLGDTVAQICDYAEEIEADQVVIGTHGKTGLARLLMGSTSIAVMERCSRPVVIYSNVTRAPVKLRGRHIISTFL